MRPARLIPVIFSLFITFFLLKGSVSPSDPNGDIPLVGDPRCIAINPLTDQAVVASTRPNEVSIVDLASQTVITSVAVGKRPLGVAIDPDLNYALASSRRDDTVSVINLHTYGVLATIPVGRSPEGIAVNRLNGVPHVALVSNNQDDSVSVIDLETLNVVKTIPVGRKPKDVAIDSTLGLALVVNEKDRNVSVIDLSTYEVTGTVSVGRKPRGVSINPETHLAVVADAKDDSITVINLQNWQTASFDVEDHPIDVVINPLDNRVLVLCDRDKALLLIDLNTNTVIESYSLNRRSRGVAVNNFTNIAAVIDDKTDSLTLIQLPNPVPEIASITPATLLRGSGAAAVTIEGSGFITSSTVTLSGTPLAVQFIDNHYLEATIPAALLEQAGSYELVVTNPAPEGGSSIPVTLNINNPVPALSALNPTSVLAGTPGLNVTVSGTGFFNDTTVLVNGFPRGFTLVNQNQLQVGLTAQNLQVGGYITIGASNPVPGGGQSNTLTFTVLNPIPSLTSIEPVLVIAGSPDFTLVLNGDNFVNSSKVNFNGQQLTPNSITKTQMAVTIPSSAVTATCSYPVSVSNPAPGGGESNVLMLSVLNPLPILSSISPTSVTEGSPDFTLTLTGDNFIPASVVSFNDQQYSSTYITKNQIEATIPASAVASAGNYEVKVINPPPGGGETSSLTFVVESPTPPVEPQPEGSFGERYQDLIPPDVTIQSYDPKRFSLITGLIRNLGGSAIADISVTILNHLEYGTAKTDANGRFSIPVEGGGTLTVAYKKEGLITAQRKVLIPWNDIAIAETVAMIPEDTKSTTLTLDGNPDTVLTHESTIFTDDRGSRSSTVVLAGDNRAYSVDASGNVIQELTTITTRATEFTTENSMPAKLPPNSAYTYCVELGVDGAERVKFEKPVTVWVDNFIGFNVGERVPVGYYDRDRGFWVPSNNGVVVRLLDTNSDGIVDALDSNNDGLPNDLNANGSFSDEVIGLGDAQRYAAGSTFWRFVITHFSPWDCNWPYGPPADAIPPNPPSVPNSDQQKCQNDDCRKSASIIEERSRVFHEDIPIPGTDINLHYTSSRVEGFQHGISVPASGTTVPASLKGITVRVEVAGRTFEQILSALPNQKQEFIWDAMDSLGRQVDGPVNARVSIGFVYDAVYLSAGNFQQAFAQAGSQVTGIRARQEVISWKYHDIAIAAKPKGIIAEGWTLSNHHQLQPKDPSTLYKGDGTMFENNAIIIKTVAGNGTYGSSGDGGPATEAQVGTPIGITVDALGNLYIADYGNSKIRRVDTNGIITTVAGTGNWGYSGDGGPATQAKLNFPYDIKVDPLGNLYIADQDNHRIRKVDTNGIITTIAGTATGGYSGDGGPAIQARLHTPMGIALDYSGNLYIGEFGNHRIRKVDTNGIITTIAGNGNPGYSGDGGPAIQAKMWEAMGLTVDCLGNLYFSDQGNSRIRKVDTKGTITTVAGNGLWGYSGDGGLATKANLGAPYGVTVDNSGTLYIAQRNFQRIRKVNTDGIITTAAGNGSSGYSGDGGPPNRARLSEPYGVAVDAAGNLYIADELNSRIRKVTPPSVFAEFTTAGDAVFAEENGLGHIVSRAGQHRMTIDLDTGQTLYTFNYDNYDSNKNLVSITDRFGNQITIQRDANGVPTAIVSPDGLTTALTIDSNNHLTRITYPDTNFYSFEYTPDGLMTAKIEPEGNRFEHIFDSNGRLTDAMDQEGGHWQCSRSVEANGDIRTEVLSAEGNLTTYSDHTDSTGAYTSRITDPTGAQTVYTRTADGLSATKSLPCGMNLTFKYEIDPQYKFRFMKEMREKTPSNLEKVTVREKTYQDTNSDNVPDLITEKVTLNGKPATLVTNTLQSKKILTSPMGRTTTAFYDPNTLRITGIVIPGLYDTDFGYDTMGRVSTINTDTRQTTFTYDPQGNLFSVTDPENRITTYSYDAVGRLTEVLRSDGSTISLTYDKKGNVTVLTNPSTIAHGFRYNKVNLSSFYHTPLSGSYGYVYNRDRRLTQINFPSGKQIMNVYDKDRLIQTQTPEGNIVLNYVCASKLGSIAKGTEIVSFGYDGSLLTSESLSGTVNHTLNYAYNNDFNVRQLTYAGGSVSYTYDNDGLLTGAGAFTITRSAGNGLPESVTGGALTLSRTFNGYGELETQAFVVNGLTLTSWGLTQDRNGRITSKAETIEGTTEEYVYTYDPVGRLLRVTKDGTLIEEYHYDSIGRRSYEMNVPKGITGRSFSYSDEDHLLAAGDINYQYDLDGFLTRKTKGSEVTQYTYSSRGELLSINLPDGRVIEYINDPMGRRIAKKISGVIIEKYLWQDLSRLLAVFDANNNLLMRFEYADARTPIALIKAGTTFYLTYDQVGSLKVVSDASGNVVKKVEYDAFGYVITDTNTAFEIPLGFAGGLYDRDTGLIRFGVRDYAPEVGRWTAKDPIRFWGAQPDLYGYCVNDPINWIDPLGLIDCKKDFFKDMLDPVKKIAELYNFDPNFLLALSAHESGWLGPHARELNNAFGLTKAGGNNLSFKSISESVTYWGDTYGSKVSGATSIDDFINKLQTDLRDKGGLGKYNSRTSDWEQLIRDAYKSVLRRRGPPCECD